LHRRRRRLILALGLVDLDWRGGRLACLVAAHHSLHLLGGFCLLRDLLVGLLAARMAAIRRLHVQCRVLARHRLLGGGLARQLAA